MSNLLSCTTKLVEPRVLYVCCSASRELQGLMEWSIQRIPSSRLVATCFIRVLSVWSHTKDDMLYSRWTCHGLWCQHVLPYVCIPHDEYARHGYTPFKQRVSEVVCCQCSGLMHGYTVSIVNGNVCGRFREVLAQKYLFCRYTNHASVIAKQRVSPTSYYKESRYKLPTGINNVFWDPCVWGRLRRVRRD
jgi:hypothetical protein